MIILGTLETSLAFAGRDAITRYALSNCLSATVLSRNVSGASPQSTMRAQLA